MEKLSVKQIRTSSENRPEFFLLITKLHSRSSGHLSCRGQPSNKKGSFHTDCSTLLMSSKHAIWSWMSSDFGGTACNRNWHRAAPDGRFRANRQFVPPIKIFSEVDIVSGLF
ncbi:hypothetical protein CEXT_326531 [Caerostris extrusa]|uniref:Ycf15 n=1 Tax=Caerostris extrusa TaxID=172846 RepID=A0AAV4XCX2_CAEEX|nr:hypothetical protein CEXT_326531 [Caerostris extrusa]